MKKHVLTDRIVIEVRGEHETTNEFISDNLRRIADMIDDGYTGGNDNDEDISVEEEVTQHEVLWQLERQEYGGFRMGSESLITEAYYRKQPKYELFPGIGKALSELAIRANIRKLSDKVESL